MAVLAACEAKLDRLAVGCMNAGLADWRAGKQARRGRRKILLEAEKEGLLLQRTDDSHVDHCQHTDQDLWVAKLPLCRTLHSPLDRYR